MDHEVLTAELQDVSLESHKLESRVHDVKWAITEAKKVDGVFREMVKPFENALSANINSYTLKPTHTNMESFEMDMAKLLKVTVNDYFKLTTKAVNLLQKVMRRKVIPVDFKFGKDSDQSLVEEYQEEYAAQYNMLSEAVIGGGDVFVTEMSQASSFVFNDLLNQLIDTAEKLKSALTTVTSGNMLDKTEELNRVLVNLVDSGQKVYELMPESHTQSGKMGQSKLSDYLLEVVDGLKSTKPKEEFDILKLVEVVTSKDNNVLLFSESNPYIHAEDKVKERVSYLEDVLGECIDELKALVKKEFTNLSEVEQFSMKVSSLLDKMVNIIHFSAKFTEVRIMAVDECELFVKVVDDFSNGKGV